MAATIYSALDDPDLEVVAVLGDGFQVRVGELATLVNVTLSTDRDGNTHFRRSHAIQTPEQAGPYIPSVMYDKDRAYALLKAVGSLTGHYRSAVDAGYEPDEGWLIPSAF